MKVMAIDLGDVRTGVAFSDLTGFLAGRCYTITPKGRTELIEKLCDAIREEKPGKVVLGLPLNMNGTEGPRAQKCRDFAVLLEQPEKTHVKRRSSVEAAETVGQITGQINAVCQQPVENFLRGTQIQRIITGAEKIQTRAVFPRQIVDADVFEIALTDGID